MSLSGGTGGQEKQGSAPRSLDSSESKTGHFSRETDLMILLNSSLTVSKTVRIRGKKDCRIEEAFENYKKHERI